MSDDQVGQHALASMGVHDVHVVDFDRIDYLLSLARAERRAELARFEMLQSTVKHLPCSALFIVGRDDHGEMYVEVAEGGAFRSAGYRADDVIGQPLRRFVEPDGNVWRGYLAAFGGASVRVLHSHAQRHYVTLFGPIDDPGQAVRFVVAQTLDLGMVFGQSVVSKLFNL